MSKFRERAAQVKAAGEATRGDFTPHGVPKRMYQWWLEHSPSEKATDIRTGLRRENFCHFWRVVVIWVPLLFVLEQVLDKIVLANEKISPRAALAAIVLLAAGIGALVATTTGTWMEVLIVFAWALGIMSVLAAIASILYLLNEHTENGIEILMGTVIGGAVLFAFGAIFLEIGFWLFVWIAGVLAVVAAAMTIAILIGSLVEGWRADRRAKANAAEEEAWDAYNNGEGPHPYAKVRKEPGRISKFFSGIGDFLVLATQVVRVKKWKICPMVEIEPVAQRDLPGAPDWS